MSDLMLDPLTGDLSINSGDLVIVSKDAAIRQRLLQNLRLFSGEWFLDTSKGVPYYQIILVKNPNLDLVEATLKNTVLSTEGIVEMTRFEFDYDNGLRHLSVTIECKSTSGETLKLKTSVGV